MRKLLLIIQELIIVNCILGMFVFLSITVQAKGRVLDEPMAKEITGIGNYGIENPSKPIIDEIREELRILRILTADRQQEILLKQSCLFIHIKYND